MSIPQAQRYQGEVLARPSRFGSVRAAAQAGGRGRQAAGGALAFAIALAAGVLVTGATAQAADAASSQRATESQAPGADQVSDKSGAQTAAAAAGTAPRSVVETPATLPATGTAPAPAEPPDRFRTRLAQDHKGEEGDHDVRNLPGQQRLLTGLSLSLGTDLSVGQSTFQFAPGYADNALVSWSSSLGAAYQFKDRTRVGVGTGFGQELTISDGADAPNTLIWGDTTLSVNRPLHRFSWGTALVGVANVRLPTSKASRVQTLRAGSTLGLSALHPHGKFMFGYSSAFSKSFHEYDNPVIDPRGQGTITTRDRLVTAQSALGVSRTGGRELISNNELALAGTANRSFAWANTLFASYGVTDSLGVNVTYSLAHSWAYRSYERDEFTAEGARAGRGRTDAQVGAISAGYQLLEGRLSVQAGVATAGPTRTADDRRIRFPFFTFPGQGVENNFTTFFTGIALSERVPL
jgi:hypothetical protein